MNSDKRQQVAAANADELRRLLAYLERELDEGRLVALAVGAVIANAPAGMLPTQTFMIGFDLVGAGPLAGAVKLLDATIVRHLIVSQPEGGVPWAG